MTDASTLAIAELRDLHAAQIATLEKRLAAEKARVLRLARMSLREAGISVGASLDALERSKT